MRNPFTSLSKLPKVAEAGRLLRGRLESAFDKMKQAAAAAAAAAASGSAAAAAGQAQTEAAMRVAQAAAQAAAADPEDGIPDASSEAAECSAAMLKQNMKQHQQGEDVDFTCHEKKLLYGRMRISDTW